MEAHLLLPFDGGTLPVSFAGGSSSSFGTRPATYTTENLMYQHIIENSAEFKRGRIFLKSELQLQEEVENYFRPKRTPSQHVAVTASEQTKEDKSASEQEQSGVNPEVREMTFAGNDDAKDYLETECGVLRSKLVNRASIVAAGESLGIKINFEKK